jgi:hypothetical protein
MASLIRIGKLFYNLSGCVLHAGGGNRTHSLNIATLGMRHVLGPRLFNGVNPGLIQNGTYSPATQPLPPSPQYCESKLRQFESKASKYERTNINTNTKRERERDSSDRTFIQPKEKREKEIKHRSIVLVWTRPLF